MDLILNIGLARADQPNVPAQHALHLVHKHVGPTLEHTLVQSDTEPTLVVRAVWQTLGQLAGILWTLSHALGQDCVAVYRPDTGKGSLIGPKADAWGDFNPAFFIMPDGGRLGA
jgi:hypothetical protein